LAVQAHRELRKDLGLTRLSITDVFGYPTLSGLAARIAEIGGAGKTAPKRRVEAPAQISVAANVPASPQPVATEPDNPRAAARADAMARRREMRARRRTG